MGSSNFFCISLVRDPCCWKRVQLGMSNDAARISFLEAYSKVVAPKIENLSVDIEVRYDTHRFQLPLWT